MQHIKHIWPRVKDLAEALGVPYTTAHSWEVRGRIPADYDIPMIRAAKKIGKRLTLEELARGRAVAVHSVSHNAESVTAVGDLQPRRSNPAKTDSSARARA